MSQSGGSSDSLVLSDGVRMDAERFTIVAGHKDERLARALLRAALERDSFPGLPRPQAHVLIVVAPSFDVFRAWVGPQVPEWGAAIAIPDHQRVVMQGGSANSDAGDPIQVLRHELAHLALHEAMGNLPPRWFDEGYASVSAGEFSRDQMFETSVGLVWRTLPTVSALNDGFAGGGSQAAWTYALSHRAVSELRELGGDAAFSSFLVNWKGTGSFEKALRLTYGITGEQFDAYWRQQTRRRYGALSLLANFSLVAAFLSFLLVPVYVSKRRRDRAKLEAMRTADARREEALGEASELEASQSEQHQAVGGGSAEELDGNAGARVEGDSGGPCPKRVDSSILRDD